MSKEECATLFTLQISFDNFIEKKRLDLLKQQAEKRKKLEAEFDNERQKFEEDWRKNPAKYHKALWISGGYSNLV